MEEQHPTLSEEIDEAIQTGAAAPNDGWEDITQVPEETEGMGGFCEHNDWTLSTQPVT